MSKNVSQTPKTAAVVEKITTVRASKEKTTVKNAMPKTRGLPDKNLNLPPTTAIDTHIITVKRDSIHSFPQNTEFTGRSK